MTKPNMNPNSEAVYDGQIYPLMAQIIDICREHRIPLVAHFQWADATHPNGPSFCTTRVHFEGESNRMEGALRAVYQPVNIIGITIVSKADDAPPAEKTEGGGS